MQNKMSKGMLMAALICGAVQWGGTPVHANELQTFEMDEFVVTAARTETRLVDTPANISVVGAEQIEQRKYQDMGEVLKDVDGVMVLDTGLGTKEKIIKLNGDDRVLVLVDGRRVGTDMGSNAGGRGSVDMNQLPDTSMIERVEVLKGAGGALYGSEAVGGVINIITKKADMTNGKISLGFGSFGAEDKKIMYSAKQGKTGVTVSASQYEQDYYKYRDHKTDTTKRWEGPTDFENKKFSINLNQEITDTTNLSVGFDYSKYEGMSPSLPFYNEYRYSVYRQDKETKNLHAKYDWIIKGNDQGYIQFYHNELEYNNTSVINWVPDYDSNYNYAGSHKDSSVGYMKEKTNGFDIQQTVTLNDNNKLVVGASWRESNVVAKGDNEYDEGVDNTSIFVSDTWEFAPTWTLNAGIRYDDHSHAGDDTTMSAGLNKKFDDNSHIYFNWSEVFRAPTTDDLFYDGSMAGGYYSKGNPNLKAETGETWTIGYASKLNNRTNFGINYFESDLDNAINWVDYGSYSQVENVDKQKKRGMEVALNHELNDNISFNATYTYLKVENKPYYLSRFDRDRNYYPNVYRFGVNYKDGKWNSNIWLRYSSGCDTTVTKNWDRGWPEAKYLDDKFMTVDMAVTYKASDDFSMYFKAYNLLNEAYTDYVKATNGTYNSPAQSRHFIIGAEYKF
ncbi:MAG: TonB-dependent receptor [Acidaminococcaceae bacterium]|nr:TonB-dependent receptor [Acidaminococcaceae bacterium]